MSGTSSEKCAHPRIVRRGGKTYCRDCKRQLYL